MTFPVNAKVGSVLRCSGRPVPPHSFVVKIDWINGTKIIAHEPRTKITRWLWLVEGRIEYRKYAFSSVELLDERQSLAFSKT